MYWSLLQSTGAEMRKYLTDASLANGDVPHHQASAGDKRASSVHSRLSTCCKATCACCGSDDSASAVR
jgi:hypothetical protein